MSFVVKKLRIAEDDAVEAAAWYDEREPGLGDDFLNEIDAAVRALADNALIHRVRFADVRRAPVRRFKFYGIYYLVCVDRKCGPSPFTTDADTPAGSNKEGSKSVEPLNGSALLM